MSKFDRRLPAWLPGGCRVRAFEVLRELSRSGLTMPQIAERLGTTYNALNCYCWRQGITVAELRRSEELDELVVVAVSGAGSLVGWRRA